MRSIFKDNTFFDKILALTIKTRNLIKKHNDNKGEENYDTIKKIKI